MTTSVSVQELHDKTADSDRITAVDTRWSCARKPCDSYTAAHIPLAAFYGPELDLAGAPNREAGRNPLPNIERVCDTVRRWGVRSKYLMIIYDTDDGLLASRAQWILHRAGLKNTRALTGRLTTWEVDGNETAFGLDNLLQPGATVANKGSMPVASLDDVRIRSERGILVDVHELSRFKGRGERVDLQINHIPGVVNLVARSLQNTDGSFLSVEQFRERFASVGTGDGCNITVYSGSGLHSSLSIQVAVEANITGTSLYVEGQSRQAGDSSQPITHF